MKTIDVKDLKIGDTYYSNSNEFGITISQPFTVVEIYPDYCIGFNPESQMTNWASNDLSDVSYNITKEPLYKVRWDYDKTEDIYAKYEKYFVEKYGHSIKDDEEIER